MGPTDGAKMWMVPPWDGQWLAFNKIFLWKAADHHHSPALSVCTAQLLQPTGPVLFSGYDRLPRIKSGAWNFIQEPWTQCYNTLPVAQLWPLTLGWRGIIINGQCQFFVWDSGLRLTFLLSSSRQRSHCQAKLNFLTKEEAVVGDEPGPG